MPLSGKKVIKLLQEKGWIVKSQKGSHVKLLKNGKMLIVPVHRNKDLGLGLLRSLEKQSGEKLL